MPNWIPKGWHSITPRLVTRDPAGLVAFLKAAFGAVGEFRAESPAQMRIGDSLLMVGAAGARAITSGLLHLYVEDTDATYERAMAAGATSIEKPFETPYGDRRAMVTDPGGNDWQIATYRGSAS